MIFHATRLPGAFLVESQPHADERGAFTRTWCQREFRDHGLDPHMVQCSISSNHRRGTLRGLHFQRAPGEEAKLVRCIRGSLFDVVVDLRPGSATHRHWQAFELAADRPLALYIPPGLAHGFLTLEDGTEVLYQMSQFHDPALASGVRWNDPAFGIRWPIEPVVMSRQDASHPDYAA